MRSVYLDYSATTPVKQEVIDAMVPYFTEVYGNPSSLYSQGLVVREAVLKARKQVADLIGADPNEIFFTSGGTEADNWVMFEVAEKLKDKGKHIITSKIEHHAILHSAQTLEKRGFDITYLDVDEKGFIKPEDLKKAIKDDTILVSLMTVNNEVGTLEPIKELAAIAHVHKVLFHTDAVQAVGNIEIDVKDLGVDYLSASAHKIYGPKGIGALYMKKGKTLGAYLHGGAQEKKKRAGTENIPGIVGFGKAAELAKENLSAHREHSMKLRDHLVRRVMKEIPNTCFNGPDIEDENERMLRHPGNANFIFEYIEGESMLLMLDDKGIAVSTGSACSSESLVPSHVLAAMGMPSEIIHGTLRMSVGDFTTMEDVDYAVDELKKVVSKLRDWSSVSEEKGW